MEMEYIEKTERDRLLSANMTEEEKRQVLAGIYIINCVVRYRSLDGIKKQQVFEAIQKKKLFFSTAVGYNDPFDSLGFIDLSQIENNIKRSLYGGMEHFLENYDELPDYHRTLAKSLWEKEKIRDDTVNSFIESVKHEMVVLQKKIHDNVNTICFCEDHLSPLMWAYYADNHRGLALLYDKKELESAKSFNGMGEPTNEKYELKKVIYADTRVDATNFFEDTHLQKRVHHQLKTYPVQKTIKNIIITKSIQWEKEKEWRLIPRKLDYDKSSTTKYLKIAPKAIIMGAKMAEKDKADVINLVKSLKGIKLYEAWINEKSQEYELSFCEVC